MRLVIGGIAGAAALVAAAPAYGAGPARWNPRAPENTQILPVFNYAGVESVLDSIGARYQRGGQPGRPVILATLPNGRKTALVFGSCDPAGSACKALSLQSYWTRIVGAPPEQTAKAVDAFNQRFSFAKAFVAPDGRPALQRYLTADYGFVRGNLAVNLLVFASQAERFAVEVLRPLERRPR